LVGSTTVLFQTWDDDPNGIKVFILAGQSNMVGYGHTETGNGGVAGAIGSLRHLAVNNASFPDYDYASLLVNPADPANSPWRTRGDVKAWWRDGGTDLGGTIRKGDLGPPFLGIDADQYGPEFAFGQVMGDYYAADDVLVIKAAWGGKSLAVDFRPPSAVARVAGTQVGPFYKAIFDNVRDVLANLGTEFPQWSGKGYQISGFGWHQGWNDRVDQTYNDEYEANIKNFIDDVRAELGKPVLPFVIATTGMAGWTETHPRALSLMNAQLAMQNFTKYPAHEGNVAVRDTRDFWRDASVSPVNQGFHWNQNGETQFLIGKSMGDLMVDLLTP
jgi:alpha-galactosidase